MTVSFSVNHASFPISKHRCNSVRLSAFADMPPSLFLERSGCGVCSMAAFGGSGGGGDAERDGSVQGGGVEDGAWSLRRWAQFEVSPAAGASRQGQLGNAFEGVFRAFTLLLIGIVVFSICLFSVRSALPPSHEYTLAPWPVAQPQRPGPAQLLGGQGPLPAELLLSEKGADVVFDVGGWTFAAHRPSWVPPGFILKRIVH